MGIFEIFDEPDSIIDPTSSYDDIQDKIEFDNEEDKKDSHHEVEAIMPNECIAPEPDFNELVTDIMNDFGDNSDKEDGKSIITDDFDLDMEDLNDLIFDSDSDKYYCVDPSASLKDMEDLILDDNDDDPKEIEDISFCGMEPIPKFDILEDCIMQDGESIKENETGV